MHHAYIMAMWPKQLSSIDIQALHSLRRAMMQINGIRVISYDKLTNDFVFHGMWLITNIENQSPKQAIVTML